MPAKMSAKNPSRPRAPKQEPPPIQNFQFTAKDFSENTGRVNTIFQQLITAVQALQGSGGRTALFSGLDVQGETVTGLGSPENETDAVSLGHAQANYSPDVTASSFDLGGKNALKGLSLLQLNSTSQGGSITAILAILAVGTGISGTLTIPKLTGGGAPGSLTFVNGIISGFVQPT